MLILVNMRLQQLTSVSIQYNEKTEAMTSAEILQENTRLSEELKYSLIPQNCINKKLSTMAATLSHLLLEFIIRKRIWNPRILN